jgi:hypothetical protein
MPSIFDKISKALKDAQGTQIPRPSSAPPSLQNDFEENSPPAALVEDAMSLPSFRQIHEEHNQKVSELTEVPIEYLKNYLRAIDNDEKRTNTADILLKELHGVQEYYEENEDCVVVGRIISALQPFASEEVNDDIKYSNIFPIHVKKATLLPKLFDDFKEAFRWRDEIVEEKKVNPTAGFKP